MAGGHSARATMTGANWAGLSQPLATAVSCANPRTEDTIGPQSVTPPHQGDMHDPLPHTHARHAVSGLDTSVHTYLARQDDKDVHFHIQRNLEGISG